MPVIIRHRIYKLEYLVLAYRARIRILTVDCCQPLCRARLTDVTITGYELDLTVQIDLAKQCAGYPAFNGASSAQPCPRIR